MPISKWIEVEYSIWDFLFPLVERQLVLSPGDQFFDSFEKLYVVLLLVFVCVPPLVFR